MTEVSKLTDLTGFEKRLGREVLKDFIYLAVEPEIRH
jgi:hypothetical protein